MPRFSVTARQVSHRLQLDPLLVCMRMEYWADMGLFERELLPNGQTMYVSTQKFHDEKTKLFSGMFNKEWERLFNRK